MKLDALLLSSLLLLAGAAPTLAYRNVVTFAIAVNSTAPCSDWFSGSANEFYLSALRALDLGMEPAVACRQGAQSLQTIDIGGSSAGGGGDGAGGSLVLPTGGQSLYINFQYTLPTPETAEAFLETLDNDVSSGGFGKRVAAAPVPLLKALIYREYYSENLGTAC